MHELGVMKHVVKGVLDAATSVNAEEIKSVTLMIGELRNFHQSWVQQYYDMLTKDSTIAGAKIIVETVPATAHCMECDDIFRIDVHSHKEVCCPSCNSESYELCTGNEIILKNIELGGKQDE